MGPDMMTIMNNHRLQEAEGPMRTINGGDTIPSSPATEVGNHNLLPAVTHLHTSKTDDNGDIYSPPRTPESETRHPISPGLDTPNKGLNESRESHSNEDDHELDLSYKNQFETSSVGNSDPDSDFDKDYDKGGLSPGSPRRPHNYNRRFDPSINPYNPIFATEEARLRLALGKVGSEIKERFNHFQTGGVEEGTRPGFLSSKPDSDLYSSGNIGSPESSPEPKSLSSPHHPFDGPYGLSGGPFPSLDEQDSALIPRVKEGIYFCHLCSFSGSTQTDFDLHMTCHFEHVCPHCDYKSRTEGRLKRHIKDFHTEDSDGLSRTMPGRPKVFRCKQCEFSTTEKIDFWTHSRTHIKEDKLLQCPRCPFVTEYKHHLEYHLRNHFGSKPFKCPKCNYACVNKSMLNSHMKSHTNVYQYRCSDCTYATKYCHSLKLHLRKYNHKPAAVLNSDGSLPQGVDATNSGHSLLSKRGPPRGPRGPRRDKLDSPIGPFPPMMHSPLGHMPGMPLPGMMSPYWPLLHGPMPNGLPSPLGMPPRFNMPIPGMRDNIMNGGIDEITLPANPIPFKCNLCSFVGNGYESLASHVMKVHALENRDLFSMFGISSDAILEESRRKLDSLSSPLKSPPNSMLPASEHSPLGLKIKTEVHDDVMTSPRPPLPERHNNMKNGFSRHPQLPSGYPFMNGKISSRDTKDEGVDILKQMTLKFGSGPSGLEKSGATDSPLDLTKPRSPHSLYTQQYPPGPIHSSGRNDDGEHSSSETSTSSNVTSPQPRKRSRKGQAFKLDTLCLKLQERHGGPNSYISDDDSIGDGDDRSIPEVNCQNTSAHNDYEHEDTTPAKRSRSEFSNSENENASVNGERNPDSDDVDVDDTDNDLGDDIPVKLTCNENRNDRSTDPDFNQIHSNLKILNSEIQIQDDKVDDHKKMNDSYRVMTERENKKNGENVNVTPVIQYQSRRKPVAAAIQKGADLALKLWNNPYITDPAAFKNGYGKTEISHLDKKLWSEAPSCTSVHRRDKNGNFECPHCQIAFGDFIMYTMHMGYHGYKDPYKCNMCGNTCKDRVEFFLHIARAAHN